MTNTAFEIAGAGLGLVHRVRAPIESRAAAAPCLILLHGLGSNEANMIGIAQRQDPRLLVIVARGPITLASSQFAWFQVQFTAGGPAINQDQERASRQLLTNFIDALPQVYGIDPKQLWIAGFSQGGIMSAGVALTQPERVNGFGLLSGRIPREVVPMIASGQALGTLSGFVSHGVQDGVLGIEFARDSHRLLTEKSVRHVYREYEGEHGLTEDMQADFTAWMGAQIDACDAGS